MSLTALDSPTELRPARTYFAGREALAEILGYRLPALPDTSDQARRRRHSAHEQVRRALAELIAAGAITREAAGYPGHNGEYVLNVSAMPVDSEPLMAHREGGP